MRNVSDIFSKLDAEHRLLEVENCHIALTNMQKFSQSMVANPETIIAIHEAGEEAETSFIRNMVQRMLQAETKWLAGQPQDLGLLLITVDRPITNYYAVARQLYYQAVTKLYKE